MYIYIYIHVHIYIYIYVYAISQGGCAGICASNFSPESSFSRSSFVCRWFSQGFCMFYVHFCMFITSLSLTWGQPAGLPSTRGYAPHMRQVFFSRPRGGTLFHGQKRKFATSGGLRQDITVYMYIIYTYMRFQHPRACCVTRPTLFA